MVTFELFGISEQFILVSLVTTTCKNYLQVAIC